MPLPLTPRQQSLLDEANRLDAERMRLAQVAQDARSAAERARQEHADACRVFVESLKDTAADMAAQ